jgi:hypothetical protein
MLPMDDPDGRLINALRANAIPALKTVIRGCPSCNAHLAIHHIETWIKLAEVEVEMRRAP